MNTAEQVKDFIVGEFDNAQQYNNLPESEKETFPLAKHCSHCLNDVIEGIPADFAGFFVLEESYYHIGGKDRFKTDLFLITENEQGQAQLSAVSLPKENTAKKFEELSKMDFAELEVNPKFNTIVYMEKDGVFTGYSESMFTDTMKFILSQQLSADTLVVQESMYMGDKRTFGFDEAIIYKRIC